MVKIALISDNLTRDALEVENDIIIYNITPLNYKFILTFFKPDFLFVESAWEGKYKSWKYKIASYPDHPKRNNNKLKNIVQYCKNKNIPTVFWNKEDGVHFNRFIDSAKLFEYIFTVDTNVINKYKKLTKAKYVGTLLFAIQEKFHNFTPIDDVKENTACFIGSYSKHIHDKRRDFQDMMFKVTNILNIKLNIYDRNSNRKNDRYRYPNQKNIYIHKSIPYKETAKVYKENFYSLNVNTVTDSNSMFSRRLIEIIACGRIAITNDSPAIQKYFKDYVFIVNNQDEMLNTMKKINKNNITPELKEKLKKGSDYIIKNHNWKKRINEVIEVIKENNDIYND